MRNLKKVLALVMALAIALTMFASAVTTVSKPSDYDSLNANAQEAVSVLSALGVINGYPDGTFKGDGIVTRAELAKMIYVMKTGDTAALFYANADLSKVFKDSVDAWAVPYINYCYLNGIIVGYEDGTVRANNPVSGVEAAKIALVALGYAPKTEGLEGPSFYNNTIRLASVAGLLKNVGGNMAEGMTRANTAVLLYNALYANTVQYVGGAATPKTTALSVFDTITLGEEGFDLLDVTAVLVANDEIGMNAYWRDMLVANSGIGYLAYEKASSGQSRFVYKDYLDPTQLVPQGYAANYSGDYDYKVVTVNIDTSFADLGRKYRLLITKPVSANYPSYEVRKVYGVIGEVANSTEYAATANTAGGLSSDAAYKTDNSGIIGKMYKRALLKNSSIQLSDSDGTIYLNGAKATFQEAIDALKLDTTAPVNYVDNDGDGTVDHLFVTKYTLSIVNAVSDSKITILGSGAGAIDVAKVVLTNGDVAKGDYVAWYKNAANGLYYVKKLDIVSGSITNYNGSKYTLGGTQYTEGSLLPDADKTLLGGYAAVNSAKYKIAVDGTYFAKVDVTGETKFQKYAILVDNDAGSVILGKPQVKLYTEDNEYVYGYVASFNGVQVYDSASYNLAYYATLGWYPGDTNDLDDGLLVSYIKDGDNVHLYTAGYLDTKSNKDYDDYDFSYEDDTDTWSGRDGGTVLNFKNENGVIFVTNGRDTFDRVIWRAYGPGEFIARRDIDRNHRDDQVLYADSPYGMKYIKAAAITIPRNVDLPALQSQEGVDIIATITALTGAGFDPATGLYTYTYTVLEPWSTATKTVTTVGSPSIIANLQKGNIYRLFLNSDGLAERYELLLTADDYDSTDDELDGYDTPANTYGTEFEISEVESMYIGLNGQITLTTDDNDYYTLGLDANVYFVKKLGTTSFATQDWLLLQQNFLSLPNLSGYRVFVEYNVQTNEILNIWIDVAAPDYDGPHGSFGN